MNDPINGADRSVPKVEPEKPELEKHKRLEQLARQSTENAMKAMAAAEQPQSSVYEVTRIEIVHYSNGKMDITGPFDDRIRFEGTLAVAIDRLHEHLRELHSARNRPMVEAVTAVPPDVERALKRKD